MNAISFIFVFCSSLKPYLVFLRLIILYYEYAHVNCVLQVWQMTTDISVCVSPGKFSAIAHHKITVKNARSSASPRAHKKHTSNYNNNINPAKLNIIITYKSSIFEAKANARATVQWFCCCYSYKWNCIPHSMDEAKKQKSKTHECVIYSVRALKSPFERFVVFVFVVIVAVVVVTVTEPNDEFYKWYFISKNYVYMLCL